MPEYSDSGNYVYRFSVLRRILHFIIMIGFLGLAVTGLCLAFSYYSLPQGIIWILGGQEISADLHRFFAVVTYGCIIVYMLCFVYFKTVLKGRSSGPHTLAFKREDLKHFKEHFLYFLGKRRDPPKFNRYTYMEKIDFWSIFIGMHTMGITGLLLWFPEVFTAFLPGYIINIAFILHFYEAILAVIIKIVIHSSMVHLRPTVYPMNKSIFTGKISQTELLKEHPGEWETYFS